MGCLPHSPVELHAVCLAHSPVVFQLRQDLSRLLDTEWRHQLPERLQRSLGNPFLRPYTDYNVDLTYILKSKYIFQASYSYTPDYFMQTVYLDSDRLKAIYNWQNWIMLRTFLSPPSFRLRLETGGTAVSPCKLP